MLSGSEASAYPVTCEFFGGVILTLSKGPQNDILTQSAVGKDPVSAKNCIHSLSRKWTGKLESRLGEKI